MSNGVILLQRPYIFSSPLLLILRREITTAAVALFNLGKAWGLPWIGYWVCIFSEESLVNAGVRYLGTPFPLTLPPIDNITK